MLCYALQVEQTGARRARALATCDDPDTDCAVASGGGGCSCEMRAAMEWSGRPPFLPFVLAVRQPASHLLFWGVVVAIPATALVALALRRAAEEEAARSPPEELATDLSNARVRLRNHLRKARATQPARHSPPAPAPRSRFGLLVSGSHT